MGNTNMFEELIIAPEERSIFEKYIKLKGVYLHKQVYDILLEANNGQKITYSELSSIIRYDKRLRDTLYIYLATAEEYLRALLCSKYDVNENCKTFKGHCYNPLNEALIEKNDIDNSYLYSKLEPDFADLMRICLERDLISISTQAKKHIKDLRNNTMHHSILIFGKAITIKTAEENFVSLENQLNDFVQILPEDFKKGFFSAIERITGDNSKLNVKRFYLEVDYGSEKICVKR